MRPSLEALFFLASALLLLTGAIKILRPHPTASVLRVLWIERHPVAMARGFGAIEILVGTAGLLWPHGPGGTAVASLYLMFAVFLVFLIAFRPSVTSCGCTGRREVPPNLLHAGLDVAAAAIAFAVATSAGHGLPSFVTSHGADGVVALAVLPFVGYALYGVVAYLPAALKAPARVAVPARHGGLERARLVDQVFRDAGIGPDDPSLWGGIRAGGSTA